MSFTFDATHQHHSLADCISYSSCTMFVRYTFLLTAALQRSQTTKLFSETLRQWK